MSEQPKSADSKKRSLDPESGFLFRGEWLWYFDSIFNETKTNERSVEIPIGSLELERVEEKAQILEVGDVLWQYGFERPRKIVDLGSTRNGVIKEDVIKQHGRFDLIVCISTLEHIGMEVHPGDKQRAIETAEHLLGLLSKKGKILITVPAGYNCVVDDWLMSTRWPGKARFLVRVSRSGRWVETDRYMAASARYGWPYQAGNVVIIAEWKVDK